jgi:antitoxin ParD1/3/4
MTTMDISLPEPMRTWVEEQVKSGMFGNASEYIRSLIREDQKKRAQQALEAKLLEGLDSGAAPWTTKDAEEISARVRARGVQAKEQQ